MSCDKYGKRSFSCNYNVARKALYPANNTALKIKKKILYKEPNKMSSACNV